MKRFYLLLLLPALVLATGCNKKGCTDPRAVNYNPDAEKDGENCVTYTYEGLGEYDFENVNFSGQTARLDMLAEMTTYMKTSDTKGVSVDAAVLKEMYANTGNHWTDAALATSGKDLKSKTFELDQAMFEAFMDNLEAASQSTSDGSNGVAGVVVSTTNPAKQYLFDENGIEWTQWIEKGLMGAVTYYQVAEVYTREGKIGESVDNTEVTPGKGTDMQHHWDEAFGYYGGTTNFDDEGDQSRFIGKYCNARNPMLGTSTAMMNAYAMGRMAIDLDERENLEEAATRVRHTWEQVIGGTAIYYLNAARGNFADDCLRNHELSEARAFLWSLRYNSDTSISMSEIDALLAELGDNNYEVTVEQINSVRDQLAAKLGLTNVASQL